MIDRNDLIPSQIMRHFGQIGLDPIILIDPRLIEFYRRLLRRYPDVYVNVDRGKRLFEGCGFRTGPVGAEFSQHRYGRALDLHVREVLLWDVYQEIKNNRGSWPEISTIEDIRDTPGWIHVDCRWNNGKFQIIRGKKG
jgi:hypothetical protein